MENVVLLPHLGSATTETRVALGMKVLDNAEAFFAICLERVNYGLSAPPS